MTIEMRSLLMVFVTAVAVCADDGTAFERTFITTKAPSMMSPTVRGRSGAGRRPGGPGRTRSSPGGPGAGTVVAPAPTG